jgi:hypothetical protein
MTRNIPKLFTMTLPILACALAPSAARAQVYTGSWPFVVTQQETVIGPGQTTTYCITLTETSCTGRTHCGSATVNPNPQLGLYEKAYGNFQVIGQLIMVTIQAPGGENGDSGWVFVASTSSTTSIGTGVFDAVGDGESFDTGLLTVGQKHGCAP